MKEPTLDQLLAADVNETFKDKLPKTTATAQIKTGQIESDTYRLNQEAERKIKATEKGKRITIDLSPVELAQAMRAADAVNVPVKDWIKAQLSNMLTTKIGQPKIFSQSGVGVTKISGPSINTPWR